MSILERRYRLSTDGYGLAVIEVTGRCTGEEAATIEANCTRRYVMVPLPNAAGAILKSLDGTQPTIVEVTPSTITSRTYRCVKVDGRVNPFTPQQQAGSHTGKTVLQFLMRYQQVGGVA